MRSNQGTPSSSKSNNILGTTTFVEKGGSPYKPCETNIKTPNKDVTLNYNNNSHDTDAASKLLTPANEYLAIKKALSTVSQPKKTTQENAVKKFNGAKPGFASPSSLKLPPTAARMTLDIASVGSGEESAREEDDDRGYHTPSAGPGGYKGHQFHEHTVTGSRDHHNSHSHRKRSSTSTDRRHHSASRNGSISGSAGPFGMNTSYKERTSTDHRLLEAAEIKKSHPGKLPVIIERHKNEKVLPVLAKFKFLVPRELTMSHLLAILRQRISLSPTQTIYLLMADGKNMCNMSTPIAEAYQNFSDADGFLYLNYASQEFYGSII